MDASRPLVVAVDLGGTRIRGALANLDGQLLRRVEWATEAEQGRDWVLDRLVALVQEMCSDISWMDIRGIGVGTPGPVDPFAGVVLSAPNIPGWNNLPLQAILEERCGLPVRLVNDANSAALGEWVFGAGQGRNNLVYITISTGIGGGVIADGRLLLGDRGLAAEVGHMTIVAGGPRCNCGNYGCWEAVASGTAIAREGAELVRAGRAPVLTKLCEGDPERVDARWVSMAAEQGDADARAILDQAAYYCGIGMVNMLHLYSPEIILVGGGVARLGSQLFEPMRRIAREWAMPAYRDVPIEPASLGDDMGLLGAVALFKEHQSG